MTEAPGPVAVWERVFRPRGVALLGATGREDSPMSRPLRWLAERGYPGGVYPVNPKYAQLAGRPCYPSLGDVPGPVDLVLALVAADRAVDAVEQAADAGAAAVVVFASGFAEVGPDGAALQDELARVARARGVRILGPNCQGLFHASGRLFATFSAAAERELTGDCGIAYLGQSGAIGGSVLDLAAERGLELSAWVSTGNQADVDVCELGCHLVADPAVSVLALYVESVGRGAAFTTLAAAAARAGKGLVVLRSGSSAAGRRAAVSHTGAMLDDDTAFTLVARRHGVVLVEDVDELIAAATLLLGQHRPRGRGVAAVTTSGGAGIIAADRCSAVGLAVPTLAVGTRARLAELIPAFGAVTNPVDVTAQLFNEGGRAFGEVCRVVCADDAVDMVLVLVTMVVDDAAQQLAHDIAGATEGLEVPFAVVWLAGHDRIAGALRTLAGAGIPVLSSVVTATRLLAAVGHATDPGPGEVEPPAGHSSPELTRAVVNGDGWAALGALGVPCPAGRTVRSAPEAARVARELGPRVVMKALAPGLEHKTEAGAVRLDVAAAAADRTFTELTNVIADADGVLIQEQVPPGFELLVAATAGRDGWPPVLTVGLGGTAVEVHRDVVSALAPVERSGALELLRSLRSWPVLAGHRGDARDVEAAADVVVRVGRAVLDPAGPAELEINPLIVGPEGAGAVAVDVIVSSKEDAWVGS